MAKSLIPTGRWVPVDQWIRAFQEAQRDEYREHGGSLAETLAEVDAGLTSRAAYEQRTAPVFPPVKVVTR